MSRQFGGASRWSVGPVSKTAQPVRSFLGGSDEEAYARVERQRYDRHAGEHALRSSFVSDGTEAARFHSSIGELPADPHMLRGTRFGTAFWNDANPVPMRAAPFEEHLYEEEAGFGRSSFSQQQARRKLHWGGFEGATEGKPAWDDRSYETMREAPRELPDASRPLSASEREFLFDVHTEEEDSGMPECNENNPDACDPAAFVNPRSGRGQAPRGKSRALSKRRNSAIQVAPRPEDDPLNFAAEPFDRPGKSEADFSSKYNVSDHDLLEEFADDVVGGFSLAGERQRDALDELRAGQPDSEVAPIDLARAAREGDEAFEKEMRRLMDTNQFAQFLVEEVQSAPAGRRAPRDVLIKVVTDMAPVADKEKPAINALVRRVVNANPELVDIAAGIMGIETGAGAPPRASVAEEREWEDPAAAFSKTKQSNPATQFSRRRQPSMRDRKRGSSLDVAFADDGDTPDYQLQSGAFEEIPSGAAAGAGAGAGAEAEEEGGGEEDGTWAKVWDGTTAQGRHALMAEAGWTTGINMDASVDALLDPANFEAEAGRWQRGAAPARNDWGKLVASSMREVDRSDRIKDDRAGMRRQQWTGRFAAPDGNRGIVAHSVQLMDGLQFERRGGADESHAAIRRSVFNNMHRRDTGKPVRVSTRDFGY